MLLVVFCVNKVTILRGAGSDLRTPLFPDGLANQDSGERGNKRWYPNLYRIVIAMH